MVERSAASGRTFVAMSEMYGNEDDTLEDDIVMISGVMIRASCHIILR
jgi:hypothetical protein